MKVNATPAVMSAGDRLAFVPEIHADAGGSVAVTYYDLRHNGVDSAVNEPLESDFFLARCGQPAESDADGCADVGGWKETRIITSSFDLRRAPDTGGLFLGDYTGLVSVDGEFLTLFARSNGSVDPVTIYFRRGF